MRKAVLFAEDPGAANWLGPLARHLTGEGWDIAFLADGVAVEYLQQRGLNAISVTSDCNIAQVLGDDTVSALVVGTSENLQTRAFDLVREAKRLNIPSFAVVDQPTNAELRFRGVTADPLSHATDVVFVADEMAAMKFAAIGLPRSRLVKVGNPHHDAVRDLARAFSDVDCRRLRSALLPDWREGQQVVVFLAEVDYMTNPEAETWIREFQLRGRGTSSYRTIIVAEELVDAIAELPERPRLIVRLHPKNSQAEFSQLEDEIDAFSKLDDPLLVCLCADLVVGMTTSLLEEAMLIGCKTLSILPRPAEAEWLPSLSTRAIPHVSTRSDLRRVLPQLLVGQRPAAPNLAGSTTALQKMARAIADRVIAA